MLNKISIHKRRQSKLSPTTDNIANSTKKPRTSANPIPADPLTLGTSSTAVMIDSPQSSPRIPHGQTSVHETETDKEDADIGRDLARDTLSNEEGGGNSETITPKPKARSSAWKGLEKAMRALQITAKVIPPVESAVGGLVSCLNHFETAHHNQEGYDEVISELSAISEYLNRHLKDTRSQGLTERISDIAKAVETEIREVNQLQGRSMTKQVLRAADCEQDLAGRFRRIRSLFRRIQMEIGMSEWSNTHEILVEARLEKLKAVALARYNSGISDAIGRRACTEHTRQDTLAEIDKWCNNPDAPTIYWMDGMAGTGKTTIAYTLTKRLESRSQLGASFFCSITTEECRKASRIIPTIAYQLSQLSTPFKAVLGEVLRGDPDAPKLSIQDQMQRLLINPLYSVKSKMAHNLIVVIDALDECDDTSVVRAVLSTLINSVGRLPLRFFITSRPEPVIYNQLATSSEDIRSVLHLHEVSHDSVQKDIQRYLKEGLEPIRPSVDEIVQLTVLSDRLFIYAATAIRYIVPENISVDSRVRLRTMLGTGSKSTKKHSGIDALYTAILSSVIDHDALEQHEQESMLSVMWAVVCSHYPVSLVELAVLAGVNDKEAALMAVGPLRSLLHVSETTGTVSTFHASFPQFIKDKSRSNAFHCDEGRIQETSALRCMKLFKSELHNLPQPDPILSPYFKFAASRWEVFLMHDQCWADGFLEEVSAELRALLKVVIGLQESLKHRLSRDRTWTVTPQWSNLASYLVLIELAKTVNIPPDLHELLNSAAEPLEIIDQLINNPP